MPTIGKTCAICSEVFSPLADMNSIVSHSATCVHSFCEQNMLDYCMCMSCSGHQKPGKRARIERGNGAMQYDNNVFIQAIDPISQRLSVNKLKKISVLSRAAFVKLKPVMESKLWFTLKGTSDFGVVSNFNSARYTLYNPINMVAKNAHHLQVALPKSAKQVWFEPSDLFNGSIDNLPDFVTRISLPKKYDHPVSHWPKHLTYLEHHHCTPTSILALPSTVQHLDIAHNTGLPIGVETLPPSLQTLRVKAPFLFAKFPETLVSYKSQWFSENTPPLPKLPASLKTLFLNDFTYNHPITLPPNLEMFRTGYQFNHPIQLPSTIKELVLGESFEQPMAELPSSLQSLELNRICPKAFPPNLVTLELGRTFSQPIPDFPVSLKNLAFTNSRYAHPIRLPPNLTTLDTHIHSYPELPASLTDLTVYSEELPTPLPPNLTSLVIGFTIKGNLPELPTSLKSLYVFSEALLPQQLPASLTSLLLGDEYPHELPQQMPPNLGLLELGNAFDHPIKYLPSSLKQLILGDRFASTLPHPLPPNLKQLRFGKAFNSDLPSLPSSLEQLALGEEYTSLLPDPLPPSLKYLHLSKSFTQQLTLPARLQHLSMYTRMPIPNLPSTLHTLRLWAEIVSKEKLNPITFITASGLEVEIILGKQDEFEDLVE